MIRCTFAAESTKSMRRSTTRRGRDLRDTNASRTLEETQLKNTTRFTTLRTVSIIWWTQRKQPRRMEDSSNRCGSPTSMEAMISLLTGCSSSFGKTVPSNTEWWQKESIIMMLMLRLTFKWIT